MFNAVRTDMSIIRVFNKGLPTTFLEQEAMDAVANDSAQGNPEDRMETQTCRERTS
jgi:hypothetical protein